ncbi:MAG: TIGR04438 family Trp-rich protein [Paucibacter sp.]|nr:TIGR04438 family Trp-rich protein [Roseateles sp.]
MALIVIGVILLLLKLGAIGPVGGWSWFIVLAPFPLALAWWGLSDMTGRTARKAMEREEARKEKRRQDAMEKLGTGPRRD